jgi:Asp-tRNA(Asn)/Glu-tRNA(Gln) amidotransferase B subunit
MGGALMGMVMQALQGRGDGEVVRKLLDQKLDAG